MKTKQEIVRDKDTASFFKPPLLVIYSPASLTAINSTDTLLLFS